MQHAHVFVLRERQINANEWTHGHGHLRLETEVVNNSTRCSAGKSDMCVDILVDNATQLESHIVSQIP